MKVIRALLHSLALVTADLAGIAVGGLAAFKVLGVPDQVWFQLPVAAVLSIGCFCVWILTLRMMHGKGWLPAGEGELKAYLALSLLWAPAIFIPFHYFAQGYLTGLGNLVALAVYQLPVNAVALFGCLPHLLAEGDWGFGPRPRHR